MPGTRLFPFTLPQTVPSSSAPPSLLCSSRDILRNCNIHPFCKERPLTGEILRRARRYRLVWPLFPPERLKIFSVTIPVCGALIMNMTCVPEISGVSRNRSCKRTFWRIDGRHGNAAFVLRVFQKMRVSFGSRAMKAVTSVRNLFFTAKFTIALVSNTDAATCISVFPSDRLFSACCQGNLRFRYTG